MTIGTCEIKEISNNAKDIIRQKREAPSNSDRSCQLELTDRCGNPATLTPSISAVEEVGMEPLEKKRREARAWVLRAANWKEFMVVYLDLGSWILL